MYNNEITICAWLIWHPSYVPYSSNIQYEWLRIDAICTYSQCCWICRMSHIEKAKIDCTFQKAYHLIICQNFKKILFLTRKRSKGESISSYDPFPTKNTLLKLFWYWIKTLYYEPMTHCKLLRKMELFSFKVCSARRLHLIFTNYVL